jgi:thymidylate kinase
MLIAVSGMVGSGKTTIANELIDTARRRGWQARCLRFQSLPCFTLLRSELRPPTPRSRSGPAPSTETTRPLRWVGYRRRQLSAKSALVYLARVVAFRIYRRFWRADQVHVLNRYFYDVFAHYTLSTARERLYLSAIRRLMPVPDLAILTMAAPGTIAKRRPGYAREYVSEMGDAYDRMRECFPELIEVWTDTGEPTFQRIDALAADRLSATAKRLAVREPVPPGVVSSGQLPKSSRKRERKR